MEEEAEANLKSIQDYEEKFGKYGGLFGLGMTLSSSIH